MGQIGLKLWPNMSGHMGLLCLNKQTLHAMDEFL
jgi:hypothetical protein